MKPQPERQAQYQAFRNLGTDFKASSAQARRRQDALDRQKQERRLAFTFAREGLNDILDDLDLSGSSSGEEDEQDTSQAAQTRAADTTLGDEDDDRFADASEDQASVLQKQDTSSRASIGDVDRVANASQKSKQRRRMPKRIKKKWSVYANRLMQGELLDLENEGLPPDLNDEWLALGPIPRGKRMLAVTFSKTRISRRGRTTNVLLLARTTGKPMTRQFVPVLPPDCVLDCVYVADQAALFVVDVLRWKGQSLAEGEAEFRMFWRDSKLSELDVQLEPTWHPDSTSTSRTAPVGGMDEDCTEVQAPLRPSHLLVLPVPALLPSSDFSSTLLRDMAIPCSETERGQAGLQVLSAAEGSHRRLTIEHTISFEIDAMTLLVKSAAYESGSTPLAAYLPRSQLPQIAEMLANLL